MPYVVAHAMNTNDIMHASCAMCALANQLSLGNYDAPENTYTPAVHMSQTTSTKINYLTFSSPK